jgi:hypothetical protein
MKKIVLAASLLLISATAHAGTYSVDGVTVHVEDGCMSSRCVSVYAPGYGYYDGATNRGGRAARVHKGHKDTSRVAATTKPDAATPTPAPAVEAAPAKPAEPAQQAQPSDAPAK